MKRRGFTIPGFKYREWEQAGQAYVYATEGVDLTNIKTTVDAIKEVVSEFNLPLEINNGNAKSTDDTLLVQSLIAKSAPSGLIDCKSVLIELRDYWNDGVLPYGLIILVNPNDYEFKNEPSDQEPAIYGWTSNQGLCVLRRFDIQKAIRHEFGHMIGLGFHHQGCVMDWSCSIHNFCVNCLSEIDEIWELRGRQPAEQAIA